MITLAMASAAAFDLMCVGTETRLLPMPITEKPFEIHLRIDLNAERWCSGGCESTQHIYLIGDTVIYFDNIDDKHVDAYRTVSRETGRYDHDVKMGSSLVHQMASCTRAPFSGFPGERSPRALPE